MSSIQTLDKVTREFKWTGIKIRACSMVAEGRLTYKSIATQLGVPRQTVYDWAAHPDFEARRQEIYRQYEKRIIDHGVALKANRINALANLHNRHRAIIRDRAEQLKGQVMGGHSGLVVKEARSIGHGEDSTVVYDEVFDAALSREYRAVIAQVADEVGGIVSKHEITGADGGPLAVTVGVMDDIATRVREAKKKVSNISAPLSLASSGRESADQSNAQVGGAGTSDIILSPRDIGSGSD